MEKCAESPGLALRAGRTAIPMRMGFSGISNKANLDGSTVTTHEEVIEAGKIISPKMEKIVRGVLRSL